MDVPLVSTAPDTYIDSMGSPIGQLNGTHKDRVVLIGDAAHALSPNGGQGASMASEDAMYLAKVL